MTKEQTYIDTLIKEYNNKTNLIEVKYHIKSKALGYAEGLKNELIWLTKNKNIADCNLEYGNNCEGEILSDGSIRNRENYCDGCKIIFERLDFINSELAKLKEAKLI
jgi:hypothetical protein